MSIGVGIFLFVVGAVLTFALNVELGWINLDLVGYLFMGAGIVVVIIGLVLLMRRRQLGHHRAHGRRRASGERVTAARHQDRPAGVSRPVRESARVQRGRFRAGGCSR